MKVVKNKQKRESDAALKIIFKKNTGKNLIIFFIFSTVLSSLLDLFSRKYSMLGTVRENADVIMDKSCPVVGS